MPEAPEGAEGSVSLRGEAPAAPSVPAGAVPHEALAILDAQRHFQFVSPAWARLYGYREEELVGRPFSILFAPEHFSSQVLPFLEAALKGGAREGLLRSARKDRASFWIRLLAGPLRDARGEPIGYSLLARPLSEEGPGPSAQDRLFFDSNPLPMCVYDRESLRFLAVNTAAVHHYGYTREEFLGMTLLDIRPSGGGPALLRSAARPAEGINPHGVREHRRKDGTCIWMELTSCPIAFEGRQAVLVLAQDVTDRLRSGEVQRSRERLLRRQGHTLMALAKAVSLEEAKDPPFRSITLAAARALDVKRASIWLYSPDRARIVCMDLYEAHANRHRKGLELEAAHFPAYVSALEEERVIAADDAHADPRTREFSRSYLSPLGIGAMLDAPIRLRGKVVGVVCHEHVGPPRHWTLEEHYFAASIADIVSIALEASDRRQAEHALREANTRLHEATRRLETLVHEDPLTGLLNRRGLEEAITREILWSQRDGSILLAILIDLDNFKQVNLHLGHAIGDIVLKTTARQIKAALRQTDYAARIGGDEFLLLLPQTSPSDGEIVAEKIRLSIPLGQSDRVSEKLKLTGSLGLIRVTPDRASIDRLLSSLHPMLSLSKRSGKNRLSCEWQGDAPGGGGAHPLFRLLDDLRRGEGLLVLRHPILRLADESTVGFEFLSRSTTPFFARPDDFLKLLREVNALTLVDYHCFRKCLAASRTLAPGMRRHINLCPSTLTDLSADQLLEGMPAGPARSLTCVELSQQQIACDPSCLVSAIRALRNAGIRIAIDDAGNCLASLIQLEPDLLKLPPRSIQGLATDPDRRTGVGRVLKVARSLGIEVIAGGIQTRDDLKAVLDLGITYGQGFLWGEPVMTPSSSSRSSPA